jgi:hypothetical protein
MRSVRKCGERGAITVWTAVVLIGFIVIIGIGVDFSGHARATQEARGIAAEAARAGNQHLGLTDGRLSPEPDVAKKAAENYVAASRFRGTAQMIGGTVIEVKVTGEYTCMFLNIIGIRTLPVRAEGTSELHSS